jgi:MFS family permease
MTHAQVEKHSRTIGRMQPRDQAWFIVVFCGATIGGWSAFLLWQDHSALPPWWYYASYLGLIVVLWSPFYISFVMRCLNLLVRRARELSRRKLDQVSSSGFFVTHDPVEPSDESNSGIFRQDMRLASMKTTQRWPLAPAIVVYLLSFTSIIYFAWYTAYSGGPFESPFAQFLVALPLLSPVITVRPAAIIAIFLTTIATALAFHQWAPVEQMNPAKHNLYIWATMGTLSVSGIVSYLTKQAQWREYQKTRPVRDPEPSD